MTIVLRWDIKSQHNLRTMLIKDYKELKTVCQWRNLTQETVRRICKPKWLYESMPVATWYFEWKKLQRGYYKLRLQCFECSQWHYSSKAIHTLLPICVILSWFVAIICSQARWFPLPWLLRGCSRERRKLSTRTTRRLELFLGLFSNTKMGICREMKR